MEADVELAVLKQGQQALKESMKELRVEQLGMIKNSVELSVKHETLEKRLVQHSARHENNYEKLQTEFKGLKEDLSQFKGAILKRLDSMSGRDSVLKVLFGAAAMAVIGGLIKVVFGF
jgi:predicted  nucleic acid-binding Zn-ribbon protein